MLNKIKNIETGFRLIRAVCIWFLVGCAGVSVFVVYQATIVMQASKDRLYVIAAGKAMEAMASTKKENLPVELRDHVRMFHERFFTLDPDEKAIQYNLRRALYLADQSAKREYDNLQENGYYAAIVSGNIRQEIYPDSVQVRFDESPYYFKCIARQVITRTTSVTVRKLVTEGYVREVSRSENNPHGMLIEKWRVIENPDIQTTTR